MKTCTKCGVAKVRGEYYRHPQGADGYTRVCKGCKRAYEKANRKRDNRPQWKRNLRQKYGMSPTDYYVMLETQGGGCAVCGKAPQDNTGPRKRGPMRLAVDHCHKTGRVRGLLCNACNRGLGYLGDTAAGLRRALQYLEGK